LRSYKKRQFGWSELSKHYEQNNSGFLKHDFIFYVKICLDGTQGKSAYTIYNTDCNYSSSYYSSAEIFPEGFLYLKLLSRIFNTYSDGF